MNCVMIYFERVVHTFTSCAANSIEISFQFWREGTPCACDAYVLAHPSCKVGMETRVSTVAVTNRQPMRPLHRGTSESHGIKSGTVLDLLPDFQLCIGMIMVCTVYHKHKY